MCACHKNRCVPVCAHHMLLKNRCVPVCAHHMLLKKNKCHSLEASTLCFEKRRLACLGRTKQTSLAGLLATPGELFPPLQSDLYQGSWFSHVFCGWNSAPPACKASSLSNELSLQHLHWDFDTPLSCGDYETTHLRDIRFTRVWKAKRVTLTHIYVS